MEEVDLKDLGRTLVVVGLAWTVLGFIIGTTFIGTEVGLGLALGGILPFLIGLGVFSKAR